MTTTVINLNFEDRIIRAVRVDGELLFLGRDVCKAMDITANPNMTMTRKCKRPRKQAHVLDRLGRIQDVRLLDAQDILDLALAYASNPISKKLMMWVSDCVSEPDTNITKGKTV